MKNGLLLFIIFCLSLPSLAQNKIVDISPDGNEKNSYSITDYKDRGTVTITSQDVPYYTTTTWTALRDRQIGALAFIDYDADGDLDLSVGCYTSASFPPITEYENFIFRNDNGILDTLPAWVSSDERNTNDIAWADVNNDGLPDFLSTSGSFQKSVIYYNSAGGLSTSPGWISNDNNWTVGGAFCDVDGDGDLDVGFANQGLSPDPYRPINLFYNNAGSLSTTPNWASSDQMITNSLAFTDINKSDIVQASKSFTANGNSYAFYIPQIPIYKVDSVKVNGASINSFLADDLNGWVSLGYKPLSGSSVDVYYTYVVKGDMAGAKWVNFSSAVYFNNGGVVNNSPGWNTGYTGGQKGIAWADIDLDGYKDLAIGGSSSPNVIYKNNAGTLSAAPFWQSSGTNTSVQDLKFADVNRDGYPDLCVVHFGYSRVDIFINRNGVLDASPTWSYTTLSSATAIAFGDVNGDGWPDLAVGTARKPVVVFIAEPSLVPVEITSFTAKVDGEKVNLNWTTASESNNKGFEVEKCLTPALSNGEGENWNAIGFVPGYGTTTEMHSYNFVDKPDEAGKYQYRLKQIDFDGTINYSSVLDVDFISQSNFSLEQNYPNPFNPSTKIMYAIPTSPLNPSPYQGEGNRERFVTLKVYDVLGNEVAALVNEYRLAGSYEVEFDASNLSSGVYFYQLTAGNFIQSKKMILLR